jgi:GNAT superfamily N-acetyltransferase
VISLALLTVMAALWSDATQAPDRRRKAVFTGWSCPAGPAELVQWLVGRGTEVPYAEFAAEVDVDTAPLDPWQIEMLPTDPHVTFLRTRTPSGRPAWVMQHGGIEHLFMPPGEDHHDPDEGGLACEMILRMDDVDARRRVDQWSDGEIAALIPTLAEPRKQTLGIAYADRLAGVASVDALLSEPDRVLLVLQQEDGTRHFLRVRDLGIEPGTGGDVPRLLDVVQRFQRWVTGLGFPLTVYRAKVGGTGPESGDWQGWTARRGTAETFARGNRAGDVPTLLEGVVGSPADVLWGPTFGGFVLFPEEEAVFWREPVDWREIVLGTGSVAVVLVDVDAGLASVSEETPRVDVSVPGIDLQGSFASAAGALTDLIVGLMDDAYLSFWDLDDEGFNDEIVAYLDGLDIRPDDVVFLWHQMDIAPKLRGKGLGRAVVARVEAMARRAGAVAILGQAGQLDVEHSLGFWQKMPGYAFVAGDYGIYDDRIFVRKLEPVPGEVHVLTNDDGTFGTGISISAHVEGMEAYADLTVFEPGDLQDYLEEEYRITHDVTERGRVGLLTGMDVPEESRNQGLGTRMLDGILREADRMGLDAVYTAALERPIPLYERAGFEELTTDRAGYLTLMRRKQGRS